MAAKKSKDDFMLERVMGLDRPLDDETKAFLVNYILMNMGNGASSFETAVKSAFRNCDRLTALITTISDIRSSDYHRNKWRQYVMDKESVAVFDDIFSEIPALPFVLWLLEDKLNLISLEHNKSCLFAELDFLFPFNSVDHIKVSPPLAIHEVDKDIITAWEYFGCPALTSTVDELQIGQNIHLLLPKITAQFNFPLQARNNRAVKLECKELFTHMAACVVLSYLKQTHGYETDSMFDRYEGFCVISKLDSINLALAPHVAYSYRETTVMNMPKRKLKHPNVKVVVRRAAAIREPYSIAEPLRHLIFQQLEPRIMTHPGDKPLFGYLVSEEPEEHQAEYERNFNGRVDYADGAEFEDANGDANDDAKDDANDDTNDDPDFADSEESETNIPVALDSSLGESVHVSPEESEDTPAVNLIATN